MALDDELQLNQSLTLIERHALLEEIYNQLAHFPIPPSIELNDLPDDVLSAPELSMYDPAPLLPRFVGAHPNKWIAYAERYFMYYRIHNTERFPYVLNHFYDEAAMWLTFYQFTEWSDFIESLVQRFGYSRNALQVFDEMPDSIETKTISAIHETIDDKVMEIQTDSIVDVHESLRLTDAQMDILDYNFGLARVTPGLNLVLANDSKKNDMGITTCDFDSYVDSVVIHSFAWKPGLTVNRVQVHDSFRDIETEFYTTAIGWQFYGSQARSLQPNIHLNVVFKNLIIVGNNLWNKQTMQQQKQGRMVLIISPSTWAIPVTPRHIIARNVLEENADTTLGYDSSPHIGPARLSLFVLGAVLPCHDFHLNMLDTRYRLMEVNRHVVPVLFDSTIENVADYLMSHAANLVKTSTTLSLISNLDSLLEFPATPISLTLKRGNPQRNRSDADNFKPNPCVSTDPIQASSTTIIVTAIFCSKPGHFTIVNGNFINFLASYGSTFRADWLWKNFHFDPGPTFVHTSYSNCITGTYGPTATDSLQPRGSFFRGKQANLNMGRNDTGIIEINTSSLTHLIDVVITNMSKEAIGSLTAEPITYSITDTIANSELLFVVHSAPKSHPGKSNILLQPSKPQLLVLPRSKHTVLGSNSLGIFNFVWKPGWLSGSTRNFRAAPKWHILFVKARMVAPLVLTHALVVKSVMDFVLATLLTLTHFSFVDFVVMGDLVLNEAHFIDFSSIKMNFDVHEDGTHIPTRDDADDKHKSDSKWKQKWYFLIDTSLVTPAMRELRVVIRIDCECRLHSRTSFAALYGHKPLELLKTQLSEQANALFPTRICATLITTGRTGSLVILPTLHLEDKVNLKGGSNVMNGPETSNSGPTK